MVENMRRIIVGAVLAGAVLLTGCESAMPRGNREDPHLLQLAGMLPGHYDNSEQVRADRAAGREPADAVQVVIAQVDSLTVGEHAFYYQFSGGQLNTTSPPGSSHEPVQRVFSLQSGGGGMLQMVWSLVEPARWRGAADQPQLLAALQAPDLKLLTGCALLWKKDGDKFTATNDMSHCHAIPPSARGAVFAHWEMELTSDTLSVRERAYDADGKPVDGREDEPFLRLRRTN